MDLLWLLDICSVCYSGGWCGGSFLVVPFSQLVAQVVTHQDDRHWLYINLNMCQDCLVHAP